MLRGALFVLPRLCRNLSFHTKKYSFQIFKTQKFSTFAPWSSQVNFDQQTFFTHCSFDKRDHPGVVDTYMEARTRPDFQLAPNDFGIIADSALALGRMDVFTLLQDDADKTAFFKGYSEGSEAWSNMLNSVSILPDEQKKKYGLEGSEIIRFWSKMASKYAAAKDTDADIADTGVSSQAAHLVLVNLSKRNLQHLLPSVGMDLDQFLSAIVSLVRSILGDSSIDYHQTISPIIQLLVGLTIWSRSHPILASSILPSTLHIFNSLVSKSMLSEKSVVVGSNLGLDEVSADTHDQRFTFFRLIIFRTLARELAQREEWSAWFPVIYQLQKSSISGKILGDDLAFVQSSIRRLLLDRSLPSHHLEATSMWIKDTIPVWFSTESGEAGDILVQFLETCIRSDSLQLFVSLLDMIDWWDKPEQCNVHFTDLQLIPILHLLCKQQSSGFLVDDNKIQNLCQLIHSRLIQRTAPLTPNEENDILYSLCRPLKLTATHENWLVQFFDLFASSSTFELQSTTLLRIVRRSSNLSLSRELIKRFRSDRVASSGRLAHDDLSTLMASYVEIGDFESAATVFSELEDGHFKFNKRDVATILRMTIQKQGLHEGISRLRAMMESGMEPSQVILSNMARALVVRHTSNHATDLWEDTRILIDFAREIQISHVTEIVQVCAMALLGHARSISMLEERTAYRVWAFQHLADYKGIDVVTAMEVVGDAAKDGISSLVDISVIALHHWGRDEKLISLVCDLVQNSCSSHQDSSLDQLIGKIMEPIFPKPADQRESGFRKETFASIVHLALLSSDPDLLRRISAWMERDGISSSSSLAIAVSSWIGRHEVSRYVRESLRWLLLE